MIEIVQTQSIKTLVSAACLSALILTSFGCKSALLAPHRARERELAPAAAEGRFAAVIDRAAMFENQNASSRDVYWYRMWRAAAMIGLDQVDQGEDVVDDILADLSLPSVKVNEVGRLRQFGYDQKAKAALARKDLPAAVKQLELALSLAVDTPLSSGGACDKPLMLAGRYHQLAELHRRTGKRRKVAKATSKVTRYVEDWTVCLARADYPGMHMVTALAPMFEPQVAAVAVAPAAPVAPVAAPAAAPAPAAPEPAPAPEPRPTAPPEEDPAPAASAAPHQFKRTRAQYAPIDPAPWQAHIDVAVSLLKRSAPTVKGDVVIRVDGAKHALRLRMEAEALPSSADLVKLFERTNIFFDGIRGIDPEIDQVLISFATPSGQQSLVAQKNDVVDLFIRRLNERSFLDRVRALR